MTVNRYITILLTVLGIVAFSPVAWGQRYYEPHFSIGGHGGMTMSKIAFTPGVEQSMVQGMTMGFRVRYAEEKLFGLIGELNITQRGWKQTFDDTPFDYSRTLTYIELPVFTHIFFGGKKFKGFVNLGPSVSYLLSDNISANFDYENPGTVEGFPIENRYVDQMKMPIKNKFDYGIAAGAGIEFILKGRHSLTLEGRYYYGLGNIFSAKKKDKFSASRCNTIEVAVGYLFQLK